MTYLRLSFFVFVLFPSFLFGQIVADSVKADSVTLIFMGDIMGHDSQINAAYNPKTKKYNYGGVFARIAPTIEKADFAIANLEVTLAGSPYKGYPRFSSPDELAVAAKSAGIDVLVTANNHSADRGKKGIQRTIKLLDSLDVMHTGTFLNQTDREVNNLLILEKNDIRLGLLNYTYGTNGLPVAKPTIVNLLDTAQMLQDINMTKTDSLDKLIVMVHWGLEYQSKPSKKQTQLADLLFRNGVDIIIGAHPHVIQKMEYRKDDQLIAYSLGNFISNQRTRKRDGGAMIEFTVKKEGDSVTVSDYGYYLTWVNKPLAGKKRNFEIVGCSEMESLRYPGMDSLSINKMKVFVSDSRKLMKKENLKVKEIKYKFPFIERKLPKLELSSPPFYHEPAEVNK